MAKGWRTEGYISESDKAYLTALEAQGKDVIRAWQITGSPEVHAEIAGDFVGQSKTIVVSSARPEETGMVTGGYFGEREALPPHLERKISLIELKQKGITKAETTKKYGLYYPEGIHPSVLEQTRRGIIQEHIREGGGRFTIISRGVAPAAREEKVIPTAPPIHIRVGEDTKADAATRAKVAVGLTGEEIKKRYEGVKTFISAKHERARAFSKAHPYLLLAVPPTPKELKKVTYKIFPKSTEEVFTEERLEKFKKFYVPIADIEKKVKPWIMGSERRAEQAFGIGKEIYRTAREKPYYVAGLIVLGAVAPPVAAKLTAAGYGTGVSIGSKVIGGLYVGGKVVEYIAAPTDIEKGEVIGSGIVDIAALGVGYKLGKISPTPKAAKKPLVKKPELDYKFKKEVGDRRLQRALYDKKLEGILKAKKPEFKVEFAKPKDVIPKAPRGRKEIYITEHGIIEVTRKAKPYKPSVEYTKDYKPGVTKVKKPEFKVEFAKPKDVIPKAPRGRKEIYITEHGIIEVTRKAKPYKPSVEYTKDYKPGVTKVKKAKLKRIGDKDLYAEPIKAEAQFEKELISKGYKKVITKEGYVMFQTTKTMPKPLVVKEFPKKIIKKFPKKKLLDVDTGIRYKPEYYQRDELIGGLKKAERTLIFPLAIPKIREKPEAALRDLLKEIPSSKLKISPLAITKPKEVEAEKIKQLQLPLEKIKVKLLEKTKTDYGEMPKPSPKPKPPIEPEREKPREPRRDKPKEPSPDRIIKPRFDMDIKTPRQLKRLKPKKVSFKQPKAYTPSATSVLIGIRGKRSKIGEITGLGIRPIVKKEEKKKKKKRFRI